MPATAAAGEEAPAGAVDAQPAVPRKRLKRAIEDSPVKQAEQRVNACSHEGALHALWAREPLAANAESTHGSASARQPQLSRI